LQGGRPLLLSGILFLDPSAAATLSGESEEGTSYLDVLDAAPNSIRADLAPNSYSSDLAEAGTLAQTKLSLITEFPLLDVPVDESTIRVLVDGIEVPHIYYESVNQVALRTNSAGRAGSSVHLKYCKIP